MEINSNPAIISRVDMLSRTIDDLMAFSRAGNATYPSDVDGCEICQGIGKSLFIDPLKRVKIHHINIEATKSTKFHKHEKSLAAIVLYSGKMRIDYENITKESIMLIDSGVIIIPVGVYHRATIMEDVLGFIITLPAVE
jgi:quercetin dioxygenase-like cupin family protein